MGIQELVYLLTFATRILNEVEFAAIHGIKSWCTYFGTPLHFVIGSAQ